MKKYVLVICCLCIALFLSAQASDKKNYLYAEAGGSGLFGSVNYERQLVKNLPLHFRLGVGFYTEKSWYFTLPVGINYLFNLKKQTSFLEVSTTATWAKLNRGIFFDDGVKIRNKGFFSIVPGIGYRKHSGENLMWRLSFTPVINNYGFVPWVGASLGMRF